MNYLGHAYLSFDRAEILLGNIIGDFVKGNILGHQVFPPEVREGIMLHRAIDTYTDQHLSIKEAKKIFRNDYGLYSGAVVDTLMDHFVANDSRFFPHEDHLQDFVSQVYTKLGLQQSLFPERFVPYYKSMLEHNWLFHYRNHYGVQRSLEGLSRKATRLGEVNTAFELFLAQKNTLQELYNSFIPDIVTFVKNEIRL